MRLRPSALLLGLLAGLLLLPTAASAQDSASACDADALVAAVEGGNEEGTLAGMADDPVGTAASSNPVLTTLVTAVQAAGLVDTLNSAEALTVFAPTDCAFSELDPATLEAALADPTGLLTTVLGFHVIAGEQISSDALESQEYETFTGEMLAVEVGDDGAVSLNGGAANVVVPDIMTANATVYLIDAVMMPPSLAQASPAQASEEPMTEATEEVAQAMPSPSAAAPSASPSAAPANDAGAAPSGAVPAGAGGTAGGGASTLLLVVAAGIAAIAVAATVAWRRS